MRPELIEHLLHEEEGTSLDFKRDQYRFGGSKADKSELLKDVLAFANAFRRDDAYILLGVEEIPGGRSKVVGVETQPEDANLQQFVNSKTQRPVTFSPTDRRRTTDSASESSTSPSKQDPCTPKPTTAWSARTLCTSAEVVLPTPQLPTR